jgi:flagellar basal body-associated protein FliL
MFGDGKRTTLESGAQLQTKSDRGMAMSEVLSKFDAVNLLFLSMIVGIVLFAIAAVVAAWWHKNRESDNATKLKLEMLDRGMSAEEIKTVLEAGRSTREPAVKVKWSRHT